ncbi:MAG: flagellar biosynthesis anti-sigma factor FlgM [Desulfobulbaceae bacterium]|uniref:Negative regulator of flagellin synthesis n=1 Tax=Candidatus Desulfobia pelagia TaxID=2841692 RepID=A0A8J6TCS0_9BACT|nr:flagellar biosynthesis anti-sigma factor FlgM [Candidatus Desulfobia pelagia]
MKITDTVLPLKADNKIDVRKSKTEDVSRSNAAEASDKVEISSGSRDAVKMQEILQSTPPERAEMVEELRAQIESDEYYVDSREIAGKMLMNLLGEQSVLNE